jgi:hypothetical protein
MVASFTIQFITNPDVGGQAAKLTASKVFAFYQKGLPEYSPNLAQLAITAALKPVADFKYKDDKAKAKDAGKIASFAVKNGMKVYKNGTRNSDWTGFNSGSSDVVQANLANIAYQATAAIAGKSAGVKSLAITEITKGLVKAAAKFKKITTNGSYAVVTGFLAQVAGTDETLSLDATNVITAAVKNAKKDFLSIAEAAGISGYNVYKLAVLEDGGTPMTPAAWAAMNQQAIFDAIQASYGKKTIDFQSDIFARVATGAANTSAAGAPDYLTPGSILLEINDGAQAPITTIQNS